jgi:hypothetical protein
MSIGNVTNLYAIALNPYGTRCVSDLSDTADEDRDIIIVQLDGSGMMKYQIRATYTGSDIIHDSNVRLHTWSVEIVIHQGIGTDPSSTERFYTTNTMPVQQQLIAQREFWKVTGVYDVIKVDFTKPPSLEGNVVSWAIEGVIKLSS